MAVTLLKHYERFAGLSTDVKPANAPMGSTFFEWDTSQLYTLSPAGWVEKKGTIHGDVQLSGSNVLKGAIQNVTTATTRVQLPSYACREVTIIGKRANAGYIYVGGSDVSATVYGAELASKDSVTLQVSNTNLIYIDSSISGEGISYVAI